MKTITLHNGVQIPALGFGTFRTPNGAETEDSVYHAIQAGFRHIDEARAYANENSVGTGIKKSGIARAHPREPACRRLHARS